MADVTLTYNAVIEMDDEDFNKFNEFMKTARAAYNECVAILVADNVPLNLKKVYEHVYYALRSKYPTLAAQCVIRTYKDAMTALRSIRSNKQDNANPPHKEECSMRLDKRLYDCLTNEGLNLTGFIPNKRKWFAIKSYDKLDEMFAKYTTADPLVFIRDGKAWIAVSFNVPCPECDVKSSVGVDMGIKRLFTTSDGVAFRDKNYLANRRKLRYLKRCLQSAGTKSAKRTLKQIRNKERNMSDDMCHRAVNTLLDSTSASVIVVEDLENIKKSTSKTVDGHNRKRHNNRFSQVPVYKFKEILAYKAQLRGQRVETVSPSYTSQLDSRTSLLDGTRQGCRYYGSDGVVLDADWNAAINIALRGEHPFPNDVVPLDGQLSFLNGRHGSTCQSHGGDEPHVQAAKSLA